MRCEILNIGGPATAKRSEDGLTVISDCYNANPASMQNALDILSRLGASHGEAQDGRACHGEAQRRRVFICGDMAELGIDAEKYHAELGRLIAGYNVSLLLTAGPLAALAADAAKQARPDLQTACFAQTAELCNNLHQFIKVSDIILIKGSRINKLEIVIEKLKKLINLSA
jgi:UDP-N-acetylmuramoyl-tripeptide--D-alanyl-D-alanine ligase